MGPRRALPEAPLGPGVVSVRLVMADADVVVLGGILLGYDGLASIHGEGGDSIVLVTTEARSAELDALLADLATELPMRRVAIDRAREPS